MFSNVSFRKLFRFPAKPTRFVIVRRARAPDAAILNGTICHSVANYGCTERNRTLKERERKRNEAANLTFFVIGLPSCFVLPCFATGCHASNFKIATAALRPRNDTKLGRFCLENRRFLFYAVVFCAVLLHIVFQPFRSGNCLVFPQNPPDLSLRGGRNFCAVSLRIVFQTFRSGNCSVFPQNPPDLSLRGGRNFCARRGNL